MNVNRAPLSYRVKAGDTLASIAEKFYGDFKQWPYIAALNNIQNPVILTAGDVLYIPPMSSFASDEKTLASNFADSAAALQTLRTLADRAAIDFGEDPDGALGDYRTPNIFDARPVMDDGPLDEVITTAQRIPTLNVTVDPDTGMETVEVSGRKPFPAALAVAVGILGLLALTDRKGAR